MGLKIELPSKMDDFFGDEDYVFTADALAEINDIEIRATQSANAATQPANNSQVVQISQFPKHDTAGTCVDMLQAEKSLDVWKKDAKRSHVQDENVKSNPSKRTAYDKSFTDDFAKPSTSQAASQSQRSLAEIASSPFPSRHTFRETPVKPAAVIMEDDGQDERRQQQQANIQQLMPIKLAIGRRQDAISTFVITLEKQIAAMFPNQNGGNSTTNSQQSNVNGNVATVQKQSPSELGGSRSPTEYATPQPAVTNFSSLMHVLSVLSLPSNCDGKWDARTLTWALKALETHLENFGTRVVVNGDAPPVTCNPFSPLTSSSEKSSSSSSSSLACGNDAVLLATLRLLKLLVDGDPVVCKCIVDESCLSICLSQSPPEREVGKCSIQGELAIAASVNGELKYQDPQCRILSQLFTLMCTWVMKNETQGIIGLEILGILTSILKSTSITDVMKFKDIWSVPVCTNYCTLLMDGNLFIEYITLLSSMAHCTEIFTSLVFHQDDSCVFTQLATTCSRTWNKLKFESSAEIHHKFIQFLTICMSGNVQTVHYLYSKHCRCSYEVPQAVSKGMCDLIGEHEHINYEEDKTLVSSALQLTVSFIYQLLQSDQPALWYSLDLKTALANYYIPLRDVCSKNRSSDEFNTVYAMLELYLNIG